MEFSEAARLLDPAPMPLEMGYERLSDGVLHIAVRTDLRGCTGEMVEWWFRFRPDTREYRWWHPIDHVSSRWSFDDAGTHIGSTHFVEESCGGLPLSALSIQFRDPTRFFDAGAYHEARRSGAVSAAVCANVGFSHDPERDAEGNVAGGRLMHIGRDTPWGCALRQHFFLGQDLADQDTPADEIAAAFPDPFGPAVLMHAYEEFLILANFLPTLFAAETRDANPPVRPW